MSIKRSHILKKNLQLLAAGLFNYVPFSGHQALKGEHFNIKVERTVEKFDYVIKRYVAAYI